MEILPKCEYFPTGGRGDFLILFTDGKDLLILAVLLQTKQPEFNH